MTTEHDFENEEVCKEMFSRELTADVVRPTMMKGVGRNLASGAAEGFNAPIAAIGRGRVRDTGPLVIQMQGGAIHVNYNPITELPVGATYHTDETGGADTGPYIRESRSTPVIPSESGFVGQGQTVGSILGDSEEDSEPVPRQKEELIRW